MLQKAPESAPKSVQASPMEVADLPDQRESRVAKGLDSIAHAAVRLADKFEQRKRNGVSAEVPTPGKELVLYTGEVEDTAQERESRAKAMMRRIGQGAAKALKATGEFAVGAGIMAGRGLKRGGEAVAGQARTLAAEYKADFQDVKTELADSIDKRRAAAAERKQERIAARADKLLAKEQRAAEARAEKARQAEEKVMYEEAYAENAAFDKNVAERNAMYEDAYAENDRFDQAAERQAQKEQARAEREQARQERAAEAQARKEARRQKWSARKAAVQATALAAAGAVGNGVNAAVDGAAQFGRKVQTGAQNAYESAAGAVVDGATAAAELKRKTQEKASEVAAATAERSRAVAESAKQGAERFKGRIDDVRAVGSAALEAARATGKTLSEQRSLEQA